MKVINYLIYFPAVKLKQSYKYVSHALILHISGRVIIIILDKRDERQKIDSTQQC